MAYTIDAPANGSTVPSPVSLSGTLDDGNTNNLAIQIEQNGSLLVDFGFQGISVSAPNWTYAVPVTGTNGDTFTVTIQRRTDSNTMHVLPHETGCRIDEASLATFPGANDGAYSTAVDAAFLAANAGAAWRAPDEGGVPVISGAIIPRALRLATQVILRDCIVQSPTRFQPATWGFPQNDAPVILIQAANTIIEHCTVEGVAWNDPIGDPAAANEDIDNAIVSRGFWVAGADSIMRFNNVSGCRGAVQLFTGAQFTDNYCHGYAFGWNADRAGNTFGGLPDEVTHNNAINNLGYLNIKVRRNYLDNRYGRVSALQPGDTQYPNRLTPLDNTNTGVFNVDVYVNGVEPREVVVGDPIDGFTITNYLNVGLTGAGYEFTDNYCLHTGRVFLGQTAVAGAVGFSDCSGNIFAEDRMDDFQGVANTVLTSNGGTITGSCNQRIVAGVTSVLPSNFFSTNTHGTAGCDLVAYEEDTVAFTIGAGAVVASCRRL